MSELRQIIVSCIFCLLLGLNLDNFRSACIKSASLQNNRDDGLAKHTRQFADFFRGHRNVEDIADGHWESTWFWL